MIKEIGGSYMAKIKNFKSISGVHCETTTTNSLLRHIGIEISEPMLFGLGQGLGYIYWNMKTMEFPFLGGRSKQLEITKKFCELMGLHLEIKETTSIKKAWNNVKDFIDKGIPVGLQLDFYYLDYVVEKIHFGGHFVAMYGYDDEYGYLVDTITATELGEEVKVKLKNIELARSEKGPMTARNLSYTIAKGEKVEAIETVLIEAIKANAIEYLNPPIKNISYKGIIKTAEELPNLLKNGLNIKKNFKLTAELMEGAGTGGSLFRNMYRDFLKESYDLLGLNILKSGYEEFTEIAILWKKVAEIFNEIQSREDILQIEKASLLLMEIANREKKIFELLRTV